MLMVLPRWKDQLACGGLRSRGFQERTARVARHNVLLQKRGSEENSAIPASFEPPLLRCRYEFRRVSVAYSAFHAMTLSFQAPVRLDHKIPNANASMLALHFTRDFELACSGKC